MNHTAVRHTTATMSWFELQSAGLASDGQMLSHQSTLQILCGGNRLTCPSLGEEMATIMARTSSLGQKVLPLMTTHICASTIELSQAWGRTNLTLDKRCKLPADLPPPCSGLWPHTIGSQQAPMKTILSHPPRIAGRRAGGKAEKMRY